MEIQTTIKEFPEKIKGLNVTPETPIRVIIHEVTMTGSRKRPYLPFLHSEVWDDEIGPADISENIDHYLYDLESPHAE